MSIAACAIEHSAETAGLVKTYADYLTGNAASYAAVVKHAMMKHYSTTVVDWFDSDGSCCVRIASDARAALASCCFGRASATPGSGDCSYCYFDGALLSGLRG